MALQCVPRKGSAHNKRATYVVIKLLYKLMGATGNSSYNAWVDWGYLGASVARTLIGIEVICT